MASSNNDHSFLASGLRGVEETLQLELDAVQTAYFLPVLDRYSSSDSESESDEERSDNLFEHFSIAPTTCDRANDSDVSDECLNENQASEPDDTDDSSAEFRDQDVHMFLSSSCQCTLGPNGRACSNMLTEANAFEMRSQCFELTSDQLDMLILGRLDGQTKDTAASRKRCRCQCFVKGHQVCRKTFLFLHGISKKRLSSLKSHLRSNGLTPRVHGNKKRTPHNRTTLASLQQVVTFIKNYAEQEGLSLPGRVPGYKNLKVTLLPTSTTKAEVWRSYKDAATAGGYQVVGYTKFVETWNDLVPFIRIMKPSTDLYTMPDIFFMKLLEILLRVTWRNT